MELRDQESTRGGRGTGKCSSAEGGSAEDGSAEVDSKSLRRACCLEKRTPRLGLKNPSSTPLSGNPPRFPKAGCSLLPLSSSSPDGRQNPLDTVLRKS